MLPSNPSRVVVTDANVLINLIHAGRLDLLGSLTPFEFVIPDHVIAEIRCLGSSRRYKSHSRGALSAGNRLPPRGNWPLTPNSGA
jgi:rRNA-processing protein FCF1